MDVTDKRRFTTDGDPIPQEFMEYHHYEMVEGFKPAFDQILVKIMPREQRGIIVRTDEEPSDLATVVAVGPGVSIGGQIYPIPFKVGDIVKFAANLVAVELYFAGEPDVRYSKIRAQDVWGSWDAR